MTPSPRSQGGASEAAVQRWLDTRHDEVAVLAEFLGRMKVELAANSGKGDRPGWMRDTPRSLLSEVQHHYVKLHAAVVEWDRQMDGRTPRPLPWNEGAALEDMIAEYAADVANMAMMVADRCGAFTASSSSEGAAGFVSEPSTGGEAVEVVVTAHVEVIDESERGDDAD